MGGDMQPSLYADAASMSGNDGHLGNTANTVPSCGCGIRYMESADG